MYLWRPSERGKLRRTKDLLSLDPRLIASSSLDRMHVFVECTRSRKKKRGEGKLNLDRRVSFYVCRNVQYPWCLQKKGKNVLSPSSVKICRSLMKLKGSRSKRS